MRIKDIRVLLVGVGNWGKNHLSTLRCLPCKKMHYDKKYDAVGDVHPNSDEYDAVIIATNSDTHFNLCKKYLTLGKHVLCEKPVVKNGEELDELVQLCATRSNQVFMAGHTMLFHPAIQTLYSHVGNGNITLKRMKHNPISGDDELYRLIPHDLSIIDYITNGMKNIEFNLKEANFVTFDSNYCKGTIQVSWWQEPPIRDMYVDCGEDHYYFHDYNETLTHNGRRVYYDRTPPLIREQIRFLELIAKYTNKNPVNIEHTQRVYKVLTELKKWDPWIEKTNNK